VYTFLSFFSIGTFGSGIGVFKVLIESSRGGATISDLLYKLFLKSFNFFDAGISLSV